MSIEASVVVPTFRRHDLLRRLLQALLAQQFDPRRFEILICDDAAEPATEELVSSFRTPGGPAIRYLPVTGVHGPAAARNVGWRAARGAIVALTDDDCVPDPNWLSKGVSAFTEGVDAVWGKLEMPLPPEPTDYERDAAGLANAVFVTANCFCRRRALEQVGGFDERFRAAWREDSDLYFSLLEHDFHIVHAPAAVVVHPIRHATWGVSLRQQRKCQFDALLLKKHPELYRVHIPSCPSWYYSAVATLGIVVGSAAIGSMAIALFSGAAWLTLTALFCWRRLRGTSRSPAHVAEMAFTSALIPPLSVYWHLLGRFRFRTACV